MPDEAADRRHFGYALDRFEGVTQMPVLERAQFSEVVLAGLVHQRVFENPAHSRGIRANHWVHAFGQHAAHRTEVFDDARARPIDVRTVLEDDVDERLAKAGLAAYELHLRRSDEAGRNRIRDLVFDEVRGAALPFGGYDDLHVADVRDGVQGRACERPDAAGDAEDHKNGDEESVAAAGFDDAFEQEGLPLRRRVGVSRCRGSGVARPLASAAMLRVTHSFLGRLVRHGHLSLA